MPPTSKTCYYQAIDFRQSNRLNTLRRARRAAKARPRYVPRPHTARPLDRHPALRDAVRRLSSPANATRLNPTWTISNDRTPFRKTHDPFTILTKNPTNIFAKISAREMPAVKVYEDDNRPAS